MSKYAKINSENIVENIIVCDDSQIGIFPGSWIKITEETKEAFIGGEYNHENAKFIPIKPHYSSWVLDENFDWVAPVVKPSDGFYIWNEETLQWQEPEIAVPEE
jgi:hypothetical protein